MNNLEQITKFFPAYDKRPKYGIHGVDLLMMLKGPEGAVQFRLSTNWQLPHITTETDQRVLLLARTGGAGMNTDELAASMVTKGFGEAAKHLQQAHRLLRMDRPHCLDEIELKVSYHPLPTDLGYHSPEPRYEGQSRMSEPGECPYVPEGQPCYYDGSSLNAERIYDVLLREGSDGVWRELEAYYNQTFNSSESDNQLEEAAQNGKQDTD